MPQARSTSTPAAATTRRRCTSRAEAFELVKQLANRKFDETVEAAFRLGVDPRKADQMLRGTVSLPAGTGKDVRVAVFADGRRRAARREEAGADVVGADDLVEPRAERGLHGLRHRDRDARPHGSGRPARPRARSARPDAEPEDRHGHDRRRQGRLASSRAARSSTAPTATATCTCRSARSSFPVESLSRNYGAVLDELHARQARGGEGPLHQGHRGVVDDGPGREDLARGQSRRVALAGHPKPKRRRSVRGWRLGHGMRVRRNGIAQAVAVAAHRRPQRAALTSQLDAAVAEHLR